MQDLEFRQFIERVKLRTPIEGVVGERVSTLRPRGVLFWACCPFHQEKTPSFAVDPRRGTWRCFGACGEGGDAISFVERFDGLTFLEALRLLALQCGEPWPERSARSPARGAEAALEARYELMGWAAETYRKAWRSPEAEAARAYLRGRGLGDAVLEAFGIGWAPEGGQALVSAAQRDKQPLDWLAEAGLVRRNEGGRLYDFFRGRVLIPIRDRLGRVVGFGGRLLASAGEAQARGPKYVNTPETPLFHKGRLIFALDQASSAIRTTHRVLVVEGYTDVMAAHQAGWKETVAVLGTATTEDHAALIRRSGARSVVLVFDGDEAGRKAGLRALAGLLKLSLELRVASLPEGRDPGDLLVDPAGAETFRACIEGAQDWFDWCLAGLAGMRGHELSSAVEERFALLARLERPLERSSRLGELARFLGLPEADVRAQWASYERGLRPAARSVGPTVVAASASAALPTRPASGPASGRASGPAGGAKGLERAFGLLVGALLIDNSLVPLYAPLLEECPEGEVARIFRALLQLYEHDDSGAPIDASTLMTALGDDPARRRVVVLQSEADEAESADVLARDQARWLEQRKREHELESLKSTLTATALDDEAAALEHLHRELRVGRVPTAKPASAGNP